MSSPMAAAHKTCPNSSHLSIEKAFRTSTLKLRFLHLSNKVGYFFLSCFIPRLLNVSAQTHIIAFSLAAIRDLKFPISNSQDTTVKGEALLINISLIF